MIDVTGPSRNPDLNTALRWRRVDCYYPSLRGGDMGRVIKTLDLADYHASIYCAYIVYLTITPRATIDPCFSLQLVSQVLITH